MVALLIVTVILLFLSIDFLVQRATYRRSMSEARTFAVETARTRPRAEVRPSDLPGDVFVDATHTWLRIEADGLVAVGASPVALAALGAPDAVELHAPGVIVEPGGPLMTFHSEGRVLTLRAPLGAVIEDINEDVASNPAHMAEGLTWLYRVRPRNLSGALAKMAVGEDARSWVAHELHRLRESVIALLPASSTVGATMLDGGAPADSLADCLDDESWERLSEDLFHCATVTVHGNGDGGRSAARVREGRMS